MFETLTVWTTECNEDNKFQFILATYCLHSTSHQQGFLSPTSTYIPHDEAQRKRDYSWKNDEHFERHLLQVLVKCGRQQVRSTFRLMTEIAYVIHIYQ
jgi:hypothetical protein